MPDGIELYLDRKDLLAPGTIDAILATRPAAGGGTNFAWIVEAPIRTLGDAFFDLTNDDDDHRETLRRVVEVGTAIGAVAANVHVVAPTLESATLSESERARRLDQAGPLLAFYVESCRSAGLLPQAENVPPVGRMREGAFIYSAIGAAPADLVELAHRFPTLRFTLDTSHAGLYLNWCKARLDELNDAERLAAAFYQATVMTTSLHQLATSLAPLVTTVHISNAAGLLGEGLPYGEGDFALDPVLQDLLPTTPFFVTETLESNPERADGMRDVQRRLLALREASLATEN
jgi:hypothetical protein